MGAERTATTAIAADQLERAVTVFAQAARLLDGPRLHVWDERGLTLPQLRILFRLRQQPGLGVRDLAQGFGVTAGNITQQVDKLVARGLVARAERPGDRRQVTLSLTPEGEQVAGEVSQTARAYLRNLLDGLPAADLEELTRLLAELVVIAAEHGSPAST
jgi:DNA-binding MarR family transcriptional regulator